MLHRVLQCMSLSDRNAQTDALVNSCRAFREDADLVVPTCKYIFNGHTRFFAACKYGNTDRVRLLLRCRANAGADSQGNVPLVAAAAHGHVEIVRLLLNAPNVDASAVDAVSQTTALYAASEHGHVSVVRLLCDRALRDRVDVNKMVSTLYDYSDEPSFAPLHIACRKNHASIVRILLDAGADVHAAGLDFSKWADTRPVTPLVIAIEAGAEAAVHELFRKSSRPCERGECWRMLQLACEDEARRPVLRALLSYCVGPTPFIDDKVLEVENDYGCILRAAVLNGDIETVKLLLQIPHVGIWGMSRAGHSAWSLAMMAAFSDAGKETGLQILGLLRDAMGAQPCPWPEPQQIDGDNDRAASTGSDEDDHDFDFPSCDDMFRYVCLRACLAAVDRGELAVVRFMLQVDPGLLNFAAWYSGANVTLLIYAIDTGELEFARELALMPGCAVNLRPLERTFILDDKGYPDYAHTSNPETALELCCRRAAEGEDGYLDMVKFLCGLPGITKCSAAEQLLQGQGAGSSTAVAPTARPGSGTAAVDAQQQGGKKKRKREVDLYNGIVHPTSGRWKWV